MKSISTIIIKYICLCMLLVKKVEIQLKIVLESSEKSTQMEECV